jgi:hypothetical protein
MRRRFISKWVVQKVVRETAEDMGLLGATPELISERIKELEGTHLPTSIVEKALDDLDDNFYAGDDELFDVEYMQRKKKERAGEVGSSISLAFALAFLGIGALLCSHHYRPFFLAGSVILGYLTAIFNALYLSRYITWKSVIGIAISLEAQVIYVILLYI